MQRQPRADNTPEKTNRFTSTSVWWPGPQRTTWWTGCSKEKNKDNLEKGQSSCENTEVVNKDMVVQHNQSTDAPTNEKRPGECVGWPGMESAIVKNDHSWIKMVESMENEQTERIRKEKNKKIREKLKEQIKKVLLSIRENVIKENTDTQVLP